MGNQTLPSSKILVPSDVQVAAEDLQASFPEPRFFPPPFAATVDGLVCVGGSLQAEWLLDAYQHGIFPWPVWQDEPMAWWSPDPRAILELGQVHVSRRLRRTILSHKFAVTCDTDFRSVIEGCATADGRRGATWLLPGMIDAYCEMHRLGHAHSVEIWLENQLVGGIYGISIGGLFAAESKFYRVRDASKVALVHLVNHLRSRGYQLLDVQQWTPHTGRMGVTQIPRRQYLHRLATMVQLPVTFGTTLEADTTAVRNG
jgi:leucyl/phenylalanyl-tRNA--protein transferase